jgi:hypothetical protein
MATTLDFIEYVCDQIGGVGFARYKKMFGEYMMYVNDKPILLVCDNMVFVKILPCLDALMANAEKGVPYNGAREHYVVDIDNAELLQEIIRILEPITPLPKPKKKKISPKARKPVLPESYVREPPQEDDEYLRNGVFCFNISKMIDDIEHNRCEFAMGQIDVPVWKFNGADCKLKEEYVEAADLLRPVIIAEIAPDRLNGNSLIDSNNWRMRGYNVLDGHHRIEKASRLGIKTLDAYILPMETHICYMYEGFNEYVEYWNEKYKTLLSNRKH